MRLLFYILCFLFLLNKSTEAQYYFYNNGEYKYFIGSSEPDTSWKNIDFIDTLWSEGNSRIGYGEKNDSTIIDTTGSLYLRIKFSLSEEETALIKEMSFIADYDDAFVAYLNGVEIARSNIGSPGEFIPYNRLADISHEAYSHRSYLKPVTGYYLDTGILDSALKSGQNILAVQVHNDSIIGCDLGFCSHLFDLTNYTYYVYNNEQQYFKQVPLDSIKLPIVILNTDEYGLPKGHVEYPARMKIVNNPFKTYNKPSGPFNEYNGDIGLEIRGQTSKDFPKKPFNVETKNSLGENLNVSLLGMPAENDWVLMSPFADKSLIRIELAFLFGRKLGLNVPRTRYCEVVLNGDDVGLYLLSEKIKRDRNRVNISPQFDITGGYIVKYDKMDPEWQYDESKLQYIEPKKDEISTAQKNYINGYFNEFFATLKSPQFLDEEVGYRKYVNTANLIDYVIINELSRNCDAYKYSTYMYKDRDDIDPRIYFGPLWDYDLAFGNATWQNGHKTTGWQFAEKSGSTYTNNRLRLVELFKDTLLVDQLTERWRQLRRGFLRNDSVMHTIDSLVALISDERIRNYTIWPVFDGSMITPVGIPYYPADYLDEINHLKEWIIYRMDWIDRNIGNIYYPLPISANETKHVPVSEIGIYPNPFSSELTVGFGNMTGNFRIEILDLLGNLYNQTAGLDVSGNGFEHTITGLSDLPAGFYILVVRNNENVIYQQKLIKQ